MLWQIQTGAQELGTQTHKKNTFSIYQHTHTDIMNTHKLSTPLKRINAKINCIANAWQHNFTKHSGQCDDSA